MNILYSNITNSPNTYMDLLTSIFIEQGFDVSNRKTSITIKERIDNDDDTFLKVLYMYVETKFNLKLPKLSTRIDGKVKFHTYYIDLYTFRQAFKNKDNLWTYEELLELSSICKYIPTVFLEGLKLPTMTKDGLSFISQLTEYSNTHPLPKVSDPIGGIESNAAVWFLTSLKEVSGRLVSTNNDPDSRRYIGMTVRLMLPISLILKIYESGHGNMIISKKLHTICDAADNISNRGTRMTDTNNITVEMTQTRSNAIKAIESMNLYKLMGNETFCSQNTVYCVLMYGTIKMWDDLISDLLEEDGKYTHSVLSSVYYCLKDYVYIQKQFIKLDKDKAVVYTLT